jgi:hypothetical protein
MLLVQKCSYIEIKRGTYDRKTHQKLKANRYLCNVQVSHCITCTGTSLKKIMILHAVSGASGVEEEDGKDEDNMMEEEVDRSLHLKVSELAWKRRWTDLFISRLVNLHERGGGQISSSQG